MKLESDVSSLVGGILNTKLHHLLKERLQNGDNYEKNTIDFVLLEGNVFINV
jgi:hypothetical protein